MRSLWAGPEMRLCSVSALLFASTGERSFCQLSATIGVVGSSRWREGGEVHGGKPRLQWSRWLGFCVISGRSPEGPGHRW
jgi:hypothetical protein